MKQKGTLYFFYKQGVTLRSLTPPVIWYLSVYVKHLFRHGSAKELLRADRCLKMSCGLAGISCHTILATYKSRKNLYRRYSLEAAERAAFVLLLLIH
jgi:hypothetical protein